MGGVLWQRGGWCRVVEEPIFAKALGSLCSFSCGCLLVRIPFVCVRVCVCVCVYVCVRRKALSLITISLFSRDELLPNSVLHAVLFINRPKDV